MHRIWLVLLLTGCPPEYEATETDHDYDFLGGEDVEWTWGAANCVVYMRDMYQRPAQARWFYGARLVAGGPLAATGPGYFRRGFYREGGKLAIEAGPTMKRFYYDEKERLSEIVEQHGRTGRVLTTSIVYDTSNRMIERYSERESMASLTEIWTYGTAGGVESYRAEANGRDEKIMVVERKPGNQLAAVRTWSPYNGTQIHEYESAANRVHVNYYTLGAKGRDIYYEYDDKYRIVARTYAPSQNDEAGSRTELVYGEKDVVERRELTSNGLLRSRSVYERGTNGDVLIRTDSNADGEYDQVQDLRDECYGGVGYIPEFAAIFSPRLTIEGEPPYRVEP